MRNQEDCFLHELLKLRLLELSVRKKQKKSLEFLIQTTQAGGVLLSLKAKNECNGVTQKESYQDCIDWIHQGILTNLKPYRLNRQLSKTLHTMENI